MLIATGEMDIPRIRSFAPIAADIGTPHVEAWSLPWGMHSAPIFNPRYVRRVVEWLGGDGAKTRTGARMIWIAVMFVAAIAFGVALLPRAEIPRGEVSSSGARMLAHYVIASAVALVVLKFVAPLAWLRLFATDYLLGFILIVGVFSAVAALYERRWAVIDRPCSLLTAILAALYAITVPGTLVISRVLHMSLSDGRWWRFPLIALFSLPLFFADEITLRRVYPQWKSHFVGLVTRGLFLAFILTGVLTLNRDHAFLVLIVPLIVIFWIALWFAAGVVHRHTQSPLAAALFSAIVQGWAFAAWFVTI